MLKVWNASTSQCVYTKAPSGVDEEDAEEESDEQQQQRAIISATYHPGLDVLNVITAEKNILLYKLQDLSLHKQVLTIID